MARRKYKICHVITRMIVGGAQENTLLSCRGQLESGHCVTLVTGPSEGPEGKLLQAVTTPGLSIHREPNLIRPISARSDCAALKSLTDFFCREQFDIVHTHSSKAGVIGRAAAWRARVPLVVHTVHGQPFHPYEKWWKNSLYIHAERWAARRCHHIFAVAQAMVDQCVEAGIAPREKYSVIYSGMEMEPFLDARPDEALRKELGIPPDSPVVGKVARLFELKGHEYLVAAAPEIVREFPDVRFLLVGDGTLRSQLERDIAREGLEENFVFAGLVPPHEVPRYTALMDILVHLSLREGLPRTVVQALATGVPAVGFDLDGTPEVIETGETGVLCPAQDMEAVKQGILQLLRHPDHAREMGLRGRERVRRQFDWHTMVDMLQDEYDRYFPDSGKSQLEGEPSHSE